jgi:putative FmdB family regulatory protein
MPIYEYKCIACDATFEKYIRNEQEEQIECPECQSKEVEKQISSFSSNCQGGYSGATGGHTGFG